MNLAASQAKTRFSFASRISLCIFDLYLAQLDVSAFIHTCIGSRRDIFFRNITESDLYLYDLRESSL